MGTKEADPYTMANDYDFPERACRRCNPKGLTRSERVNCPDCDGFGLTQWAALATSPWTNVHEGLWMGGCDWNDTDNGREWAQAIVTDDSPFDAVVSMYRDWGVYGPARGSRVEHHGFYFNDASLNRNMVDKAVAATVTTIRLLKEGKQVLVRCQAGLNRSGLVTALTLHYGFNIPPAESIPMLREKRSPWVLCNEDFEEFLLTIPV